MPPELIKSFVLIKRAIAKVNESRGYDSNKVQAIEKACDEILQEKIGMENFPLVIYQTGSGTQTNMNVNEVIANRATEIMGGSKGEKLIHPNDDVNKGQSSNDTFPTAMHVATVMAYENELEPNLKKMIEAIKLKEKEFEGIIKIGRTHTQDATPVTLSQEFSGFRVSL